jgi:hypothetical protein
MRPIRLDASATKQLHDRQVSGSVLAACVPNRSRKYQHISQSGCATGRYQSDRTSDLTCEDALHGTRWTAGNRLWIWRLGFEALQPHVA